jgi:hypothetical protein
MAVDFSACFGHPKTLTMTYYGPVVGVSGCLGKDVNNPLYDISNNPCSCCWGRGGGTNGWGQPATFTQFLDGITPVAAYPLALLSVSGGVWTFVYFLYESSVPTPPLFGPILFRGTTSASPVKCGGNNLMLTFSNAITIGSCYSMPDTSCGTSDSNGLWAMAQGGSAVVTFRKACCNSPHTG